MSKGSNRRPTQVADETFTDNWDRIFGKAKALQDDKVEEAKASEAESQSVLSVPSPQGAEGSRHRGRPH